ncbi:MAG: ABC transporter ATP-binding protein [Paracoccaceae bacterium]
MLLEVKQLTKVYPSIDGPIEVLRGIDLQLAAGETLALTGESGSGKSTLLHLVGGLDTADGGRITLAGHDVLDMDDRSRAELRRTDVGVIFQQFNLIPSLDVSANIAFQARLAGSYDEPNLQKLAASLGLDAHLDKFPEALSGGQQQRVAIARTLLARPKLILADEPTGNLDEETADDVLEQMLGLVAETGAAMMVVTHSEKVASRMQRRARLNKGRLL